tara:strand:+ start:7810 stop:9003 length:1194 start_codon:yes stop_codon:yes gene_type:complete
MSKTIKIEADLGGNGGRPIFVSYPDLRSFVLAERDAWAWLRQAQEPTGQQSRMPDRIDNLLNAVDAAVNAGRPLADMVAELPGYFDTNGNNIVHHESALGSELLDIRDSVSPSAAAFAYSFHRGWAQINHANTPDLLRGALMLVVPGVIDAKELVDRFSRERANYRSELRRVMAKSEIAEANRAAALSAAFDAGRKSIRRWAGKRAMRWYHYSTEQKSDTDKAIADIVAVQKTYEEAMALQAPSKYWRDKAVIHRRAETWAAWRLAGFFCIAGAGLTAAFYQTAVFFLSVESDPRNSVYFVASAGLATVAGLILWIGRLLTRLYLSEHHLRKDAEERRIMTTTYLALMRKTAAGDADRQVILGALFRNSSDGIVKDDGASDIGLSALVSRLGFPQRS